MRGERQRSVAPPSAPHLASRADVVDSCRTGSAAEKTGGSSERTTRFNRECQGSRSDRGAAVREASSCRTPALISARWKEGVGQEISLLRKYVIFEQRYSFSKDILI